MKWSIPNEVKTGVLGIVALALFIFGFNFLKGKGVFSGNNTYYAVYNDANGLTPSSFILLKGINIGNVREIYLSKKHPGKIEVAFSISKEYKIPTDSKVNIISSDLLGTKALNINTGTATTYLNDLGFINTEYKPGFMDEIGDNVKPIITKVDGTVANANNAITTINGTVSNINSLIDAQTKANLQQSISRLNASVADFNLLSSSLAEQRGKIASVVNSLDVFAKNLNSNNAAINSTLANIKSTTDQLNKADIAGTVNNLKSTLGQLDNTLAKINNNQGSVGMLINDKKLYNDLQASLHSLDALLADLKNNPQRYVQFSLISRKQKTTTQQ
jgi:phospholipid/cholesterol/gamma-HCH transport system substrate-binding protein